jgi:oxaloacetate decarboxylase alpha subunit
VTRALELLSDDDVVEQEPAGELDALRSEAAGLASSEEELLLLALFGEEAEPLLRSIRERAAGEETLLGGGVDQTRAERIREIVRIVQETGIAEISVEEAGTRVSVRRTEEPPPAAAPAVPTPEEGGEPELPPVEPLTDGVVRVEAPMVGTFYRAAQPGAPPFVEEGDPVAPGQTLCILEAMKLMNEVKAEVEGVVRTIHVQNGQAVEFGQPLFDLEPLMSRPLDAL